MKVCWIQFAIAAIVLAMPAAAQANLILDPGFENQPGPSGGFLKVTGGQTLGGVWTVQGNDILNINQNYTENNRTPPVRFNSHSGANAVDLTGAGNTGLTNGISQSVATVVGQVYGLSFFVGTASASPNYTTPSTVNVVIGGNSAISFTNSNVSVPLNGMVNWMQVFTSFVATNTSTTIGFFNGTLTNNYVGLDDVSLVATPEPSTLISGVIAGLTGIGYGWRRRRNTVTA